MIHSPLTRFIPRVICALTLPLLFALCCMPTPVEAGVLTSDIVLGSSAKARDIDPSELPDISAPHAIVMGEDGRTYYERDADSPIKIASTTKIMTALVALEHSELGDTVTVDHAAATVGESCVGLLEGDTLTMEDALTGLMVMSGNDVAMAIASSVGAKIDPSGDDPFGTFIDAMNAKAAELGCTDTVFENPHGLDFGAWAGELHSTARDMATIYAAAHGNEQFKAIDTSDRTSITVTGASGAPRTLALTVRNAIKGQAGNIGGKTGTTGEAGNCFVGTYEREAGGTVYIAVFGCEANEQRWDDSVALSDWYYDHIATVPLANSPSTRGDVPVIAEVTCADWTDKTAAATLANVEATMQVFSLGDALEQKVELDEVNGTVEKGQNVGTLSYLQGDAVAGEAELVAAENVAAPNPFEWAMVQFDRVVRFFTGKPAVAESLVLNEAPSLLAYDAWNAA